MAVKEIGHYFFLYKEMGKNFDETFQKNFDTLKSQCEVLDDASRKSSIDFHIRDLIEAINSSENYFTTSSCSGRFIAFSQVKLINFIIDAMLIIFLNISNEV